MKIAPFLVAVLFAFASFVFAYFFTTEPWGAWKGFDAGACIWSLSRAFRFTQGGAQ